MKKCTHFTVVIALLSAFAASSFSALADDHKKSLSIAPATQQKSTGSKVMGTGSKGLSDTGKHNVGGAGASSDIVNGAVNNAVGGAVSGAVGGLLGAFGPK